MVHLSKPEGLWLKLWPVFLMSQRFIRPSIWCRCSRPVRGIHLLWCALLLIPCAAHALNCPSIPEQTHKDWEVEIRVAVGKIGAVKGAELETLTRNTTRDLMGKLPQADKIYLEQMMYATFCSALRDDPALTESQKSTRIKAYNLEMRKTLYAAQGKAVGARKFAAKDAARAALAGLPLPYTPDTFVESANKGELAVVKLFLAAGMDPNAKDQRGNTALMYAAGDGHAKIIEVLLKAKANVNERNEEIYERNQGSFTALSWAASSGQINAISVLLDHGADAQAINVAFLNAAAEGRLEALRMLLKRGADKGLGGEALIETASYYPPGEGEREADMNDVIRFLLKLGVDVNTKGRVGRRTALLSAVNEGHGILIVQTLLNAGADVNAKDEDGWTTLLMEASTKESRAPIMQTLLAAGADVNAKCTSCSSFHGWTALMMAARDADLKPIVDILLARDGDPNLTNDEGKTSLLIAMNPGGMDTVHALLDRGANVNAKDENGTTALMEAQKRSHYYHDTVEMSRLLLERHADVNAKDNNDFTALIWAGMYGQAKGIGALLDAGADLHARNVNGRTALMLAIREGAIEAVHTLLRKGAKVNDEDANGKTPLNYAEEDLEGKAQIEMMRILKKAGAK